MTLRAESITPGQRADLIAVLRPYEHELEPGWVEPPGHFERKADAMFGDPDRWLWWGVSESGERVGFAIFRKFRDWPDESKWAGSVAEFCIFPAHRRRGYGAALARLALAALKEAGCHKVVADVLWHRADSLAFWKSAGFEPVFIVTELIL